MPERFSYLCFQVHEFLERQLCFRSKYLFDNHCVSSFECFLRSLDLSTVKTTLLHRLRKCLNPQRSKFSWKLLLIQLLRWLLLKYTAELPSWYLRDRQEKNELSKRNQTVSIYICIFQKCRGMFFKIILCLLIAYKLSKVVWSQALQEIAVRHHCLAFFTFAWCKYLKYLLGARKKSNFVFVVTSDAVGSWCCTLGFWLIVS